MLVWDSLLLFFTRSFVELLKKKEANMQVTIAQESSGQMSRTRVVWELIKQFWHDSRR